MHGQRMCCWLVVITRSVELFVNYCAILITLVVCDKIRLVVVVVIP